MGETVCVQCLLEPDGCCIRNSVRAIITDMDKEQLEQVEYFRKKSAKQRKKAMLKGRIRPIGRHSTTCEHCGERTRYIENIDDKVFRCVKCFVPPTRFCVDVHFSGKRYRIYSDAHGTPLDTYERAFKLLATISESIRERTFDPSRYVKSVKSDFLFEVQIERWLAGKDKEVRLGNIAPSSVRAIRSHLTNHILPWFKGRDVREIRNISIKEFYYQLPEPPALSSKSVKNILGDLQSFFNSLELDEVIPKAPLFPAVTVDDPEIKWCDRNTQDAILAGIPEQHRPILFFLTRQGCRPGEVLALQWADVDLTAETLTIRRTVSDRRVKDKPKNKKVTPRLLHPENVELLRNMRKGFPSANIFVNPETGRPYLLDKLEQLWNAGAEKAGKSLELYQGTRHSVASQATSDGVDINAVKAALGHSDIRMTQKYAHADLEAQRRVFRKPSTNRLQRKKSGK